MADRCEQKVRVTVGLPDRIVTVLATEAKRRGISFGDQVRRALDEWHETKGVVKILDRTEGRILQAR